MSNASSNTTCPLPKVRRVITGHTPTGQPAIICDEVTPPTYWAPGSINGIHNLYRTDQIPTSNNEVQGGWTDLVASSPAGIAGLVSPTGATFRTFDYAPGSSAPMHRTESLDFGIIVTGSIVLEMEGGVTTKLNQGDVIVQRGTIHSWKNDSNEWTRIYWVVLGAKPVEVNGQVLGEDWSSIRGKK